MKNLYLIGTSHIAKESIQQVNATILSIKPAVIAVELDVKRLPALFAKKTSIKLSDIFKIGIKAYLFGKITAAIEKKLGKLVGIAPGSEMKAAIMLARKHNIKLALIDQDIEITLKRLSKSITWKEKLRFIKELISAVFKRKQIPFDITKVPPAKIIHKLTEEVKKKYPSIHQILIQERDLYMAKVLKKILADHPGEKVVAVVGAGHVNGILQNLKLKEVNK